MELKIGLWNTDAQQGFAQVIEEGAINLYKVYSKVSNMVGSGQYATYVSTPIKNYMLQKNGGYILAHPTNHTKFTEAVAPLISERIDVLAKVQNRIYTVDTVEQMVRDYNATQNRQEIKQVDEMKKNTNVNDGF